VVATETKLTVGILATDSWYQEELLRNPIGSAPQAVGLKEQRYRKAPIGPASRI
jgi:hypothetical protein